MESKYLQREVQSEGETISIERLVKQVCFRSYWLKAFRWFLFKTMQNNLHVEKFNRIKALNIYSL